MGNLLGRLITHSPGSGFTHPHGVAGDSEHGLGSDLLLFPQLLNCQKIPEVKVIACLVWKDWPYRIHPHSLVGKDCNNGLCEVTLRPQANPKHRYQLPARHRDSGAIAGGAAAAPHAVQRAWQPLSMHG